jgi:hypothetical protein
MTYRLAVESLPQAPAPRFRSVSLPRRRMTALVKFLARDLGEPESLITKYVRRLGEARMLPADPGHAGCALATPAHAAILLVAYLGSRSARGAVNGARELGAFQYQGLYGHELDVASLPLWVSAADGAGSHLRIGWRAKLRLASLSAMAASPLLRR